MFDWNDEQQQVGDAIWAEFNESEDHIVPYPKGAEDSTLVRVRDHENNDEEAGSIAGVTEQSAGGETELQGMEKQHANPTSTHFSATRHDMESWPDLPSLNPALDRNYSDDNIASTYLDFSADASLQKVTGNATVQLDGESEVFDNDLEEKGSSFLDCDWGNIGDFDDFDRLFSNSDSIFGNEMASNDNDFLSASSELTDNAVQSVLIPQVPVNKQPSSDHGPSLLLINEISGGITKQENKGDVQKTLVRSRRKQEERGKVSNIQAEDHQTKLAATSYQTSADSPKHSSSIEKSQDIPSRPPRMTRQEKIEKLRRRQQMQALIAIQQQQQQFGQEGSGSDTIAPQAYSPRNKNPDSFGGPIVIDENTNKVFSPEMIPMSHNEVHKSSAISDDPFIEEKIYYQLQDALGKLDTKTRLCIRDSLLRLARSARERQITGDRSSTNKTTKDEDEASEQDTSTRSTRSPTKEAETTTNPIDRIVAHLLFHRHCSKVVTATKEETIPSTRLLFEPESKIPQETSKVPSEDQQNEQKMVLQPSQ
ncbi:unnamed protein product [Urochloa humidicola]